MTIYAHPTTIYSTAAQPTALVTSPPPELLEPSTAESFHFAHPYPHTPAWAQTAARPLPDKPATISPCHAKVGAAATTNDSATTASAADLFHQPLTPQDYRAASAFVQHATSRLLETVDRRRPLAHLRGYATPDIMDIVEQFSARRSAALLAAMQHTPTTTRDITPHNSTSPSPPIPPAPLRLLRLHLRARRLTPPESATARALERALPPGYQAAVRPGQQAKPTSALTTAADLRVEVCGTYRDGVRVKAFAGAATRMESKWRLTSFNFV